LAIHNSNPIIQFVFRIIGLAFGILLLASCAPRRPISDIPPIVAPIVEPVVEPVVGKIDNKKAIDPPLVPRESIEALAKVGEAVPQSVLPSEVNIDVPFYPQAPDGNWNLPWQEACEEASAILAYYAAVQKPLTKDLFKQELQNLFEWENKRFGSYKDTTIEQTAQMIREYWRYDQVKVIESPTTDRIKQEVALGHLLIAPFSGHDIKNPFYSRQGPYYHMMVIKGYDAKNFITNDVGTRKGADYRYPFEHLMSALHDWDPKDIRMGKRRIIILDSKGLSSIVSPK